MPSRPINRREFVSAATFLSLGLPVVLGRGYPAFAAGQRAATAAPFAPPASPRTTLNFNLDWKFLRDDASGAEAAAFDDAKWSTVSTPHSFNDVDSFRTLISHGGGDRGTYKGLSWYRKHFKLPADLKGRRVFVEFEGMRQAGDIFLNGKQVGLYENGINAYGIDITEGLRFGDSENVLAVKVDNTTTYKERGSSTSVRVECQRLQPGPWRHQSPRVAARHWARFTRRFRSSTVSKAKAFTCMRTTSISRRRRRILRLRRR